jgi:hypothetical protein
MDQSDVWFVNPHIYFFAPCPTLHFLIYFFPSSFDILFRPPLLLLWGLESSDLPLYLFLSLSLLCWGSALLCTVRSLPCAGACTRASPPPPPASVRLRLGMVQFLLLCTLTSLAVSDSQSLTLSYLQLVVDRAPKNGARASPELFVLFARARASLGSSPNQTSP